MKSFREILNEKYYKLLDYNNREIKVVDYHGNTAEVVKVYKDGVDLRLSNNEVIFVDIEELKEQDSDVNKIK